MRGYSAELDGSEKVVEVAVIARVGDVMDSAVEQGKSSVEDRGGSTVVGQGNKEDDGWVVEESGLVVAGCAEQLLPTPTA